ncbi:MAG: hypothetical protein A2Y94_02095 [Caldithrix sp. RBG_13_44_9]|nr:MAG: hypothetical protein A2Y94_02095 [Caldithrix sp. RBG_13_44_9]
MKNIGIQILLCLVVYSYSQDFPDLSVISEEQIRADLYHLTSQEFAGREAGVEGGIRVGDFIAESLRQAGLQPLPGIIGKESTSSFFQEFQIKGMKPCDITAELSISFSDSIIPATNGIDFHYFFNSDQSLDTKTSLVFAGYAIEAPEYFYNDFSAQPVKDKIVLGLYGEPLEKDTLVFFNGTHQTKYSMEYWKAKTVAEKGGKALILIPTPDNKEAYSKILQRRLAEKNQIKFVLAENLAVPVIYLSTEFSDRLWNIVFRQNFESMNDSLRDYLKDHLRKLLSWPAEKGLEYPVKLAIDYKNEEIRKCGNIIAYRHNTEHDISDEYLIIGAHYDHEGMKDRKIFPGADDNASGVVANLQVAMAYVKSTKNLQLKRNLVFAFWDAEEKGQLGTQYFVEHSPIPLEKLKVVFNMDMIGRDASFNFAALRQPMKDENAENKVMIFYSAQTPFLRDYANDANHSLQLHLLFDPNVFFTSGSDHVNFHSRKVPVVYYFTGFHTDYTSVNDTADKINYSKLTRITRHIANFLYLLVNAEVLPEFDSRILSAPEGDFIR